MTDRKISDSELENVSGAGNVKPDLKPGEAGGSVPPGVEQGPPASGGTREFEDDAQGGQNTTPEVI